MTTDSSHSLPGACASGSDKHYFVPSTWGRRLLGCLAALLLATVLSAGISIYSYKAVLAVAGLFVGALILSNPFIGLLVVVAGLPFETLGMLGDPETAGAISVTKLGGLATVAALVLDTLFRRRPIALERLAGKLAALVCLLVAATILSAVLHPSEESSKESIRLVTIAVFFFVTVILVNSRQRLRRVILVWVAVASVVASYSLYQRHFGATIGSGEWTSSGGAATVVDVSEENVGVMSRAAGTFTHPGWLALYLTLTIPLALYAIWTARRVAHRVFWLAAAGVQATAVMVTFSRTGYLAMAMGVVLFLIRRRGGAAVVLWGTLLTVAVYPLWPDTVKARVESILDYTKSSSSVTRIGQHLVGWWMFRDNMLTGVGPGNFEENVKGYADRVPDKWRVEVVGAHNMYVEMLAELGVQGLVLLLLILLLAWRITRRARKTAPNADIALMYESMGVSLIVFAFSAALIHAQYQKEWWLLLGLIAAGDWIAKREHQRDCRFPIADCRFENPQATIDNRQSIIDNRP